MGMTGDKGSQGTGMITPDRKPPGGELSDGQKAYNSSVNRIRAAVERASAHLKNWKILRTGYLSPNHARLPRRITHRDHGGDLPSQHTQF
jgi:hypothetical protein